MSWLNPFSPRKRQAKPVDTIATVIPQGESRIANAAERDITSEWRQFIALAVDKGDLMQVLEEYPFEPRLRELAGETLLYRYQGTLTIEELNHIIVHTAGMQVCVKAGSLVMERANDKDDLAQVLLSVPSLRVQAARRTLAMAPETRDLMRCLNIPEVADEAFKRLIASVPPRETLLHMIRFDRDDRRVAAVKDYLAKSGRRVDITPPMQILLRSMCESEHTRH